MTEHNDEPTRIQFDTQAMQPIRVPPPSDDPTRLVQAPLLTPFPEEDRTLMMPVVRVPRRENVGLLHGLYVMLGFGVLGGALILVMSALLIQSAHVYQTGTAADTAQMTDQQPARVPIESLSVLPQAITATPMPTLVPTLVPTLAPSATPTTPGLTIEPWDGKQRFTMLVMGLDKRPGEAGSAFRTDTMILVSIDPATHSIGMLSVPRDLFVSIPAGTVSGNYGLQRINAAYVIGESVKPGSGPMVAMQTVQYNFGMRINSYLVVDFQAVIAAIDAVGGIDVDVPQAIYDAQYPSMNYGYDPLYIPAGHIHMNGTLALKYARTRHSSDDLERARRQQQVITLLRDKILSRDMIPTLIAQSPVLWGQLADHVKSDLTLDQLLRLGVYLKDIPAENIHKGVFDYSLATPTNWDGMSVLVPNRTQIGPLLVKVFGSTYAG